MYEGNFAPVGDVAFRCPPRDLYASARSLREHASLLQFESREESNEHIDYLYACALWYEDMGCLISEIRLLPEVLAKSF